MRWFLFSLIMIGFLQLPEPTLLAEWHGNRLIVVASPGSLYLVGGGLQEQYIGQELVTLRAGNTDQQYTPIGRTAIELRNANGETIASLPVPDKPPETWIVILPIVVRS